MPAKNSHIREQFTRILYQAELDQQFSPQKFLEVWIEEQNAYSFLFKKNLRVTNIQMAELMALIRCHCNSSGDYDHPRELQFLSVGEFRNAITELVAAFPPETVPLARYERIAKLYELLLRRVVLMDCYFGSCAVFTQSHLKLDLEAICGESGYVHSCGRRVFIRNVNKATKQDFFKTAEIAAGRMPVTMEPGPVALLHWIPGGAPDDKVDVDLKRLGERPGELRPLASRCYNYRDNADGLLAESPTAGGRADAYAQLFRNGVVEMAWLRQ